MFFHAARSIDSGTLPWDIDSAHWVIPGPWHADRVFYFCLRTGEAVIYSTSSDVLTDEDLINHWPQVDEADRLEIAAFIKHGVFEAILIDDAGSALAMSLPGVFQ